MLHFGAEVSLRRLNQIQKPALRCLWKHSALAGSHGNPELSFAVLELVSFLVANGFRAAVADVATIRGLSTAQLEDLAEALLAFGSPVDLKAWLVNRSGD
jgi:hypothetical protein